MKPKDIKTLSDDELEEKLLTLKKEQLGMRFHKVAGSLTNTAKFREARRAVARIKTEQAARKAS